MSKTLLVTVFILFSLAVTAQETATQASTTIAHQGKAFSITYGITTPFGLAPYNTGSTAHSTDGSYAIGPIEALYHIGLSDRVTFNIGIVGMYHKDVYSYNNPSKDNYTNLVFGGGTVGLDYHFGNGAKLDPYLGMAAGVGYFWGTHGANDLGLRYKNKTVLLLNPKLGVNLYNKKKNAWVLEAGYHYLTYLKVGYLLTCRK